MVSCGARAGSVLVECLVLHILRLRRGIRSILTIIRRLRVWLRVVIRDGRHSGIRGLLIRWRLSALAGANGWSGLASRIRRRSLLETGVGLELRWEDVFAHVVLAYRAIASLEGRRALSIRIIIRTLGIIEICNSSTS